MPDMKHFIVALLVISLPGCQQKEKNTFTPTEAALIASLKFDAMALSEIKGSVTGEMVQYETSDPGVMINADGETEKSGIEKREGISFKAAPDEAEHLVLKFKDDLREKGYLIFVSESGFESPSTVTMIRSKDQFDILRFQKTDGINYGIENKDVISKLEDWNRKYGIEIIGADYDWTEFILKKLPDNVSEFSQEVYKFCPDVVDQGVGEISELEKVIANTHRVYLWWD
jgi:hypothetical protein